MTSDSQRRDQPLVCPSCALRHEEDERFCASCGMPLTYVQGEAEVHEPDGAQRRARKIDPRYSEGELVRAAGGRHQAEAEMIQGMLLEEGVPSVLRRSPGFDVPDFLAAGPRDVMVPLAGYEAAREVLLDAQLVATGPPPAPTPATAGRALRLAVAIGGGATLAATAAWALVELAG